MLKHGRADFSETVQGRFAAHDFLNSLPFPAFGGQKVLCALGRLC